MKKIQNRKIRYIFNCLGNRMKQADEERNLALKMKQYSSAAAWDNIGTGLIIARNIVEDSNRISSRKKSNKD